MNRSKRSSDALRTAIQGPVNSIPTTFLADGSIDWNGIANIIECGIGGGSEVSLLTYGDSQFDFLTDDEVTQLTKFLVERVNRRSVTVAATRRWPTHVAEEFARFCLDSDVDVLMVLPSDFASNCGRIEQYRAIARIIPEMLVGCPAHTLLDALVDTDGICAFKEDGTEAYAVNTMRRYAGRWTFLTGGHLWRNFTQWPCGCRAYFCWLAALAPEVSQRYWNAVLKMDAREAGEIISEIEAPAFALAESVTGGWQAVWRAALEINGVASRHLRMPMESATDRDVEAIDALMNDIGLT